MIKIYWDSHAGVFKKFSIKNYKINCKNISGATISGLPKRESTLNIKNKIIDFLKKEKPDYFVCHLITSLPILISKIINQKTKFILRISGLVNINLLRKYFWILFGHKIFLVTCPTISTLNHIKNKNIWVVKSDARMCPVFEKKLLGKILNG